MRPSNRRKEDEDVFEFRDEDNPEPVNRWSEFRDDDDDGITKYQFLQSFSSGPVAQMKEVPTVTIGDDDDDGSHSTDDCAAGPLDTPHKAGCEVSQGFCSMSDRILEQCPGFTDNSVVEKDISPGRQLRVSTVSGTLPEICHASSMIPESPCRDGPVDFEDINGNDMVEDSFPSTPDFEPGENNDPPTEHAHCQSFGQEMDGVDTIAIHTDYVAYGDKYFPASLILITGDSVKMKASALEEGCATSSSEWKIEDILRIEAQCSNLVNVAKVRIRLLTKDAADPEIAETSGVGMVEFLVPNWSHQKERMMALNMRYNAVLSMGINMKNCDGDGVLLEDSECSSDPYIPNFEEPFEEVIYPKGEIDAVSVRKSDVDLLRPDVFINDTIIDFYITYLKNGIPRERRQSFHFFSSFFFRKLADLDKNPSSISDGKAAFQRVRRWTRKVNIFEKDYIFIPVNYNLHWSLIVLCHPGEVVNFNDKHIDDALKVPCILHMDSIRGSHTGLKDLLQSYLMEEWKERHKDTSEEVSSAFLNLRFLSLELPQQENCSDCGLFLLHYAELFIDEAPVNFSPFRINKFDNFLARDWFVPAEGSLKRVHIQRLIHELLKSRSHECVSPSGNNLLHPPALPVNKEDDVIQIVSEKRFPVKSLNGSSLYSESVQDVDIGQLDMPLDRPSGCSGTTDLLEHCQHYNQGTSLAQLGFSITSIREVESDDQLANSNAGQTGLHPIDRSEECLYGSPSRDFDQGFPWNVESSDQSKTEDTSSSNSHSSYEHSEETSLQTVDSYESDHMDLPMEIMDSQEGYASASSDMMETPPEDSQELDEKYGNHDELGPLSSELEEVVEGSRDSRINENKVAVSDAYEKLTVEDREVIRDVDEEWIVGDSQEDSESNENEVGVSDADEKLTIGDNKAIRDVDEECIVKESQEDLGINENKVAVFGADERPIIEDNKATGDVDKECIVEDSPPDQLRPVKRPRITPSQSEAAQVI